MTANQISFSKAKEEARHNRAMEGYYTNQTLLGRDTLNENIRHNLVSEGVAQTQASAAATQASAAVTQANTAALRQAEDVRHNKEVESQQWFILPSQQDVNRANTALTQERTNTQLYQTYIAAKDYYNYDWDKFYGRTSAMFGAIGKLAQ